MLTMSNTLPAELQDLQAEAVLNHIPNDKTCFDALSRASKLLSPAIFNHSLRTFLLAQWLAAKEDNKYHKPEYLPLLFIACICHDFGTCDTYNGKQRFEVEGADAAVEHLQKHGVDDASSHQVWVAIALHTSSGIAERINPLARLVRLGVSLDFRRATRESFGPQEIANEIEKYLPRLDIEKDLSDAVVKQAVKIPDHIDNMTWPDSEKHPKASWPGILLRAHLLNPGHEGVNPAF